MSSLAEAIQEMFKLGQSSNQICKLLKCRSSRSSVYELLKRVIETGLALLKVRITPDCKVRTLELIKKREKIRRNPKRSVRKLASASGLRYGTMKKVLTCELFFSFKKIKSLLLSETTKT